MKPHLSASTTLVSVPDSPRPLRLTRNRVSNLNDLLIKRPEKTFIAKASANTMIGAGINDCDMLVVDRGLTNYKDKVVIEASTASSPSNATR